jgi:hypothetical protein
LNLYAESTMRQEAEAFGTANRPDLFNMLDTYFRERRYGEVRRIPLLRTPMNKPEIKAGLWRWTSLGLLVPGTYGGIENDRDRQS